MTADLTFSQVDQYETLVQLTGTMVIVSSDQEKLKEDFQALVNKYAI